MLVVLGIIALAVSLVPGIFANLAAVRLGAAADEMADTLRELRLAAISRGSTTELRLDPAARAYTTSAETSSRHFPEAVDNVVFESAAALTMDGAPRLRFFADGSAIGGTIVLKHGARAVAITVDWLTGRVRRRD